MSVLLERAKSLRQEANQLEKEYETAQLPELREQFKYVVGSCYEVKNRAGDDKWLEYMYVKAIEDIHLNSNGQAVVSLDCFQFTIDRPYFGLYYVGHEQSYLHTLENYGKKISVEKFNKKFAEFRNKLLSNGYSV